MGSQGRNDEVDDGIQRGNLGSMRGRPTNIMQEREGPTILYKKEKGKGPSFTPFIGKDGFWILFWCTSTIYKSQMATSRGGTHYVLICGAIPLG